MFFAEEDYNEAMSERSRPLATMADAHREWHANAGTPVGTPGCPQDACDGDESDA